MRSNKKYWKVLKSMENNEILYFSIFLIIFSVLYYTYDYEFVFIRNEKSWQVMKRNEKCWKVVKSNEKSWKVLKSIEKYWKSLLFLYFSVLFCTYDYDFVFIRNAK